MNGKRFREEDNSLEFDCKRRNKVLTDLVIDQSPEQQQQQYYQQQQQQFQQQQQQFQPQFEQVNEMSMDDEMDSTQQVDLHLQDGINSSCNETTYPWKGTNSNSTRMSHQVSANSLSSIYSTYSCPPTPSDLSNSNSSILPICSNNGIYPSDCNPSAFSNQNQVHSGLGLITNQQQQLYQSQLQQHQYQPQQQYQHQSLLSKNQDEANAFAAYALGHGLNQSNNNIVESIDDPYNNQNYGGARNLEMPVYGWDNPKQTVGMSGHMI